MGQKPKSNGLRGEWRGRSGAASRDNSFKNFFWEGEQRPVRLLMLEVTLAYSHAHETNQWADGRCNKTRQ